MVCALLAWWWFAPIVGGTDDIGDPAVVAIAIGDGQCSGVVVAPRVVLTAAHCIALGSGTVDLGGVTANVVRVWVDRYYTGDGDHDLAALELDRDAAVAPLAIAAPSLGAVRLVGFGATQPGGTRGVRHEVTTNLVDVTARQARAGGPGATSCTGDSGGAALDATGALVGVIIAGDDACTAASYLVRPDAEPLLAEVIAAWSGAPPTDPCGFEGTCALTCPTIDLDCPLVGLAGAVCMAASDCESRLCAGDDRGRFCSAPCVSVTDCQAPLDACFAGICAYSGGTPGIAGAACTVDHECRSELCDVNAGACTVPCGAADVCPAGLVCGPVRATRACTQVGGCAIGGGDGGWVLALGTLAACTRGRRRRRAH